MGTLRCTLPSGFPTEQVARSLRTVCAKFGKQFAHSLHTVFPHTLRWTLLGARSPADFRPTISSGYIPANTSRQTLSANSLRRTLSAETFHRQFSGTLCDGHYPRTLYVFFDTHFVHTLREVLPTLCAHFPRTSPCFSVANVPTYCSMRLPKRHFPEMWRVNFPRTSPGTSSEISVGVFFKV